MACSLCARGLNPPRRYAERSVTVAYPLGLVVSDVSHAQALD